MIVDWNSDEEHLDLADVVKANPAVINEAGVTLRWNHKGEERVISWSRMRNALDAYRDYEAAFATGTLREVPHVMLHWSEARPLLSAGNTNVVFEVLPTSGDSRCNT